MAIHGPRKQGQTAWEKEQSEFTLTKDQIKNWRKVLMLMGVDFAFNEILFPDDLIRKAAFGLIKRVESVEGGER